MAPANAAAVLSGLTAGEVEGVLAEVQAETGVELTARDREGGVVLEAVGVQAHASTPDEGRNAITALLDVVSQLALEEDGAFATAKALHQLFPYGDNRGRPWASPWPTRPLEKLTLTPVPAEAGSGRVPGPVRRPGPHLRQ